MRVWLPLALVPLALSLACASTGPHAVDGVTAPETPQTSNQPLKTAPKPKPILIAPPPAYGHKIVVSTH